MNCIQCNFACHYPCRISNDEQKWKCDAMNWREAGENSVCQVCTGKCSWRKHFAVPYWIEFYEEEQERTFINLDDLLMKFETVKREKKPENVQVKKLRQKVKDLQNKVVEKVCEVQQIIAHLNEDWITLIF